MKHNIYNYKFSKIGTNPSKYLENYELYINQFLKGSKFIKEGEILYFNNEIIFQSNSYTTTKQNIDCWMWMGFLIKIDENEFIKIVNKMDLNKLKEHIKYSILMENDEELVNRHRNTIIIKLLFLDNKDNLNINLMNVSYDEIKKECGNFEKTILKDRKYLEVLKLLWGANK